MDHLDNKRLKNLANEARKLIINVACSSRSAHVGSSLSCVDILISLYFRQLRIDKNNWDKRDIFVLSKAHAAMALYSVLKLKGFIGVKILEQYLQDNGTLPAHLDKTINRAIEASAGSLGHGFNIALGIAYGYKLKGDKRNIYTLIGDGESQEGSIWEGALFASKLGIDNFTAVMDHNNLQGYGRPTEICHFEPMIDKWEAFGWQVYRVDGHDYGDLISAFNKPGKGKPRMIIADTCKGKGVSFMENQMKWHYFIVTDELKERALQDLCRVI